MAIPDAVVPAPEGEWVEPTQDELQEATAGSRLRRAVAGVLPEDMWNRRTPPRDPLPQGSESHDRSDDDGSPLYEPSGMDVSTASTDRLLKGKPDKAAKEAIAQVTVALVGTAGGLANMVLADDEDDPAWLMQEEEAQSIGVPLASIAARRAPAMGDGNDTSDLVDGFMAILGLGMYAMRNLMERRARRRALRATAPLQDAAEAAAA